MFKGYIDDSGSADSNLFTLSCVIGHTSMWLPIELAWLKCVEEKSDRLRAQGRRELTRFHAACSSRLGEFKGWSVAEQIEFMSHFIRVIQRHRLGIVSYTLDLRDLVAEFPEAEGSPYGLAHVLLRTNIMKYIGDKILGDPRYRDEQIALIHDRSDYGAVLLEAFNHVKTDQSFMQRDQFTTIRSMAWEKCVPLQLADFLAYENFKIIERESAGFPRRKSMELILALDSWGGRGAKLQRAGLRDVRGKLDAESMQTLFNNARIRPRLEPGVTPPEPSPAGNGS